MNIIVTGAGGFIGSHLAEVLDDKHKVFRVFSNSTTIEKPNSFVLDLSDELSVRKIISELSKQSNIDIIIHLANKMASVNQIEDVGLLKENIAITENIISIAKKIKPRIIINCSSMAVYPNITGAFSEKSVLEPQKNPDCLYGLSKVCAEVMFDFMLRNEKIRIVHLRISQVHGKGMRDDRIIPSMLEELKSENKITVFGNGERTSNFININKLLKEISFFIQEDVSGVYNVGDQNISYIELAQELIDQYGDQNSTIKKEPQGNKEKFVLDVSKLKLISKA